MHGETRGRSDGFEGVRGGVGSHLDVSSLYYSLLDNPIALKDW